jgi:hypothetical protein
MGRVEMTVKVFAKKDSSAKDGIQFHLEDCDGCVLDRVVFDKTKHKGMHKKDEHLVYFELHQDPGMMLKFATDANVALWVAQGTEKRPPPCPQVQPNTFNPIFYGCDSQASKLTAVNSNPKKCFFSFTLNFVDSKSATPNKLISYDPVGQNKNGGVGLHDSNVDYAAVLIGAAAAGLLGYLAYRASIGGVPASKVGERHRR